MIGPEPLRLAGKNMIFRSLHPEDEPHVLDLFLACESYFQLSQGHPAKDANEFFTDLPPDASPGDKFLFGIFDEERPVAVADLVRNYPGPGIWIIGLLAVHPALRRLGAASLLHDRIRQFAMKNGAKILRAGILERNAEALAFWSALGYEYRETTEPRQYGSVHSRVIVMHLELTASLTSDQRSR